MTLKVLSWNILGGKYLDKVIKQLKEIDADIIGLQEVKEHIDKESNRVNIAQTIAQTLGYHFAFCESFIDDRHEKNYYLGNAILSRFPLDEVSCLDLSRADEYRHDALTEPRVANIGFVRTKNSSFKIINTHLGYSRDAKKTPIREEQLKNLIEVFDNDQVILMGDFNSIPESFVVKELTEILNNTDSDLSKVTKTDLNKPGQPQFRIDYIFVSKDQKFSNFQVLETDASDHKPITVEIEVN